MSKIGKLPIQIPAGVTVDNANNLIVVKGPRGELSTSIRSEVNVTIDGDTITTSIDHVDHKNLRGLSRTLIDNMIIGVTDGYTKKLLIIGVGYAAKVQGQQLTLNLGYSHPIDIVLPDSIKGEVEQDPKGNSILTLTSPNKQLIGQIAAQIRSKRPPEPYKGKGVRYFDEQIKLKPGKSAK